MTKPKDRRNEFNRQHKRILEERTELLAKLDGYDRQKAIEIEAALAPVHLELQEALAGMARFRASNKLLEKDLDIERGVVEGLKAVLQIERQERDAEKSELEAKVAELAAKVAAHAPDKARLEELVARWEGRARKDEYAEANALLNRKVMAEVVPAPNRRG
jgi:hypothetical protein